jgi:hypothetical protein
MSQKQNPSEHGQVLKESKMKTLILATIFSALLFSASAAQAAALLNWTDNSTIETGVRIYRAPTSAGTFVVIGTVGVNVQTFTDPAGVAGNCYKVTAFNTAGESAFSNTACLVQAPGNAPSGLTVTVTP